MTTPTSDRGYRIDTDARSHLRPGVDADALERLLQHLPAESRASHLDTFSTRAAAADIDGRIPDVTVLDRISDPLMQQLLEAVWQPFWAALSDAELTHASGGPPGLELARRVRFDERRG